MRKPIIGIVTGFIVILIVSIIFFQLNQTAVENNAVPTPTVFTAPSPVPSKTPEVIEEEKTPTVNFDVYPFTFSSQPRSYLCFPKNEDIPLDLGFWVVVESVSDDPKHQGFKYQFVEISENSEGKIIAGLSWLEGERVLRDWQMILMVETPPELPEQKQIIEVFYYLYYKDKFHCFLFPNAPIPMILPPGSAT